MLGKPVAIVTSRTSLQLAAAVLITTVEFSRPQWGLLKMLPLELLTVNPPSIDPHYFLANVKSLSVLGPYWGEKFGKVSMRAFQG
jgi:hypothetical protein